MRMFSTTPSLSSDQGYVLGAASGSEKAIRTHREGCKKPLIMFLAYHNKGNHFLDGVLIALQNNKVKGRVFIKIWFLLTVPGNSSMGAVCGD